MDEDAEYENNVNEDILAGAKYTAKMRKACSCANPNSTLAKMTKKMTANKKLDDPARVRLIDEFYQEC
jgi:hypothetical protein